MNRLVAGDRAPSAPEAEGAKSIGCDGELYVLTRSLARAEKERAMRQRV